MISCVVFFMFLLFCFLNIPFKKLLRPTEAAAEEEQNESLGVCLRRRSSDDGDGRGRYYVEGGTGE